MDIQTTPISDYEQGVLWLKQHDPRKILPKSLLAATADAIVFASAASTPVCSAGSITGGQASNALAVDNAIPTSMPTPGSSGWDAFVNQLSNSPLTGCTSLIDMARITTGFNPLDPGQAGNSQAVENYINALWTSPFYTQKANQSPSYTRNTNDWGTAINQIAAQFAHISPNDLNKIVQSLRALTQAATSHSNTWDTMNLFVQNAINVDGTIEVYFYHSQVAFMKKDENKSTTLQTQFNLHYVQLEFNIAYWQQHVHQAAAQHVKRANDWLNEMTTPPGSNAVVLCF